MRITFAFLFALAFLFVLAPATAQTVQVNNLKKEFVPNVSGTATKPVVRDGIASQYASDQSATLAIGIKPYDNNLILLYLYLRNNTSEPLSIDPSMFRCAGTSPTGENSVIAVLDPVKLRNDRMGGAVAGGAIIPATNNSTLLTPLPGWYTVQEQATNAIQAGDLLPGEQISGIVFLKQPYGPVTAMKRGPTSVNTQTEILFKDFTVTVPVGGKDYTFNFTVDYNKK